MTASEHHGFVTVVTTIIVTVAYQKLVDVDSVLAGETIRRNWRETLRFRKYKALFTHDVYVNISISRIVLMVTQTENGFEPILYICIDTLQNLTQMQM